MGRTNPTLRDEFDRIEREWTPFRRALRRRHQPAFDAVFERARAHADAGSMQNPRDPWRALVFCVLVSQEAALAETGDGVQG